MLWGYVTASVCLVPVEIHPVYVHAYVDTVVSRDSFLHMESR